MIDKEACNSIREALIEYLDTYFIERDFEKTIDLFGSEIAGYGTGGSEKAYNLDELRKVYKRDLEQAPNKIDYTITKLKISTHLNNTGIVSCELYVKTHILNQEITLNNLRLSVVFIIDENKWLIEHMHISLPTIAHEEDEAYPIKELEEQNTILKRLVDEKTKTLNDANKELEKALSEIKTLRGILPICCNCKSIRTDNKSWQLIESYITEHSDASFTHSLCPKCAKKLYPGYNLDDEEL